MAGFTVAESVTQAWWQQQQQSLAFVLLDPSWWGYILGSFLPGSSLYTLKQVCKSWRALTASPYYTMYAPLRITTKLLGRLTSSNSSLAIGPASSRLNILKQVSLQCGGRICLGLPRTAVEFHGVVVELLEVTGPVQQITVSLDTSYVPVVDALHRLVLRSTGTLVELKLRGARVAQQLCEILGKTHKHFAARSDDNAAAANQGCSTSLSTGTDTSSSPCCSRRRLLLLPQLRNLETDNVFLLRELHAPKLLSLFVDYNSVPPRVSPPRASCAARSNNSMNSSTSPGAEAVVAGSTVNAVCPLLSAESNGFPRLVLLEFLSRSGICLQRLTQAAILPMWYFPRTDEALLQDADTRTLLQMGVALPNLKELSLSDVSIFLHLHTVNLSMLALELSQVAVLPVLFQHQRQQQLAAQLQELVLRLSPYRGITIAGAIDEGMAHSGTCALYKRIHGRLRSSPFPSSSYEAIGLSLQSRSRCIQTRTQTTDDEKRGREITTRARHETSSWENGGSGGTESISQASAPAALTSSAAPYRSAGSQSPAENSRQEARWEQQQAKLQVTTTSCGTSPRINLPGLDHDVISASETTNAVSCEAFPQLCEIDICPLLNTATDNTAHVRGSAARKQAATTPFGRHRTWSSRLAETLKSDGCSVGKSRPCRAFENIFQGGRYELVCTAACSTEAARTPGAPANSPGPPSPVVVLLNLTHLTAPWSLLGLLVCPNLRQLHVTGMIQRVNVLNFLRAAAPLTECLVVEKLHIDLKNERGEGIVEAQERGTSAGGRRTADVTGSGENVVTWCLLQLKKYKGPAALLSDDVECPNLEYLEVTDEDTTGELARFLFATQSRCPKLKRLSLKSFCPPGGGAQLFAVPHCSSPHSRTATDVSATETATQRESVARKCTAELTPCASPPVKACPHGTVIGSCAYSTRTAGGSITHRAHTLLAPLSATTSKNSRRFSTSRVRRSWFDQPSTTSLELFPSCARAGAGAAFSNADSSVASTAVLASNFCPRSSAGQYRVEALHLSRLNARQVADWLAVAPPVARMLLMQVKILYVDHLEQGRKAMARFLAALPMLEYVEIQRIAGMTERLLMACFAFRGFHPCRKHLSSPRSPSTGKQAAQWCFVRQAVRERCAGEADTSIGRASVTKQIVIPPLRRKWLPAKSTREEPRRGGWFT